MKPAEVISVREQFQVRGDGDVVDIDLKKRRLVVHHRYEWLHIVNDFALAGWFLVGSILFFFASAQHLGTWLFVLGSAQMMMGPLIRVAHKLHMRHLKDDQLGI